MQIKDLQKTINRLKFNALGLSLQGTDLGNYAELSPESL